MMNNYIRLLGFVGVASVFGVAFTGCGSTDDPAPSMDPAEYITFGRPGLVMKGSAGIGESPLSRSALADRFGAGAVESFKVWGYCVPRDVTNNKDDYDAAENSWTLKSRYSRPDVFEGQSVSTSDGTASYSPAKEWSQKADAVAESWDYKYTFIACANAGDRFSMSTGMGVPTLTFAMPFSGGTTGTERDHNAITDALVAATFDHTRRSGKVDLSFYHILTGIRFRFHNHTDGLLTINSVTFSGRFYSEGRFSFEDTKAKPGVSPLSEKSFSGTFSLLDSPQTVGKQSSELMGKSTANPDGTTLLLLPNPDATPETAGSGDPVYSLGADKNITIKYTFEGGEERTWTIENFKLSYVPGANVRHTANFNFVGDEFVLVFQADNELNWEDGSDNDIQIN